jgi:DNA gyrase subunit A
MPDTTERAPAVIAIEDEMKDSFMAFAMSVITARALPDVRDGLKPAQRRILYDMHEMNLAPGSRFMKCAGVVGDTMKNYHPHGDLAIYPTLARLAQDWNLRYLLVDGHGNFGSIDGDPPGAMRYTECRLSPFGAEMMADIEKGTVDLMPNFDQTRQEPTVLPSLFPNLLCNGGSGIAVGMATNLAPHNLGEVVDALCLLADSPKATLKEVMKLLPGPDFPTGGLIFGTAAIREAYESGRASITLQGRATIEPLPAGRQAILVTELPYQVNKASLVEQIGDLVNAKRISDVSDIRDESDRKGMRVVVELKRDANPHVVLNSLYKLTRLRTTFPVNAVVLVDGAPRTLGLLDLLCNFLEHRRAVVTRRTQFELNKAKDRAHILEGYLVALKHLDQVIELIKKAPSPPAARDRLVERFKLSERQAQAILELMLQRLTSLERNKILEEHKEIIKQIASLEDLLANPRKLTALIKQELIELKEKRADPRRTQIRREEAADISVEDLIAEEDMVITITRDNYIKRLPLDTYRAQRRGGKGIIALTAKEEDVVSRLFVASTHHYIFFFTNRGKVYRLRAHEIPLASRQARGSNIINLIQIQTGERVTATRAVKEFRPDRFLFMATTQGTVKKTPLSDFETRLKGGLIALNLHRGDELHWVAATDGKREVILTTERGMAIRFPETQVRPMGRAAAGVRGIRLRKDDRVVSMSVVSKGADLLVATRSGFGKRTPLSLYRPQARGGLGLKTLHITANKGPVVDSKVATAEDDLLIITTGGQIIRQRLGDIRPIGRATQGVRLIRLEPGDAVASIARVIKQEEAETEG